jgi:hypothetical protein
MITRFQVDSVIVREDKLHFIMAGIVVDGMVTPGMRIQVPTKEKTVEVPVFAVENVKTPKGIQLGLIVRCGDWRSLEHLISLKVGGMIVDILEAPPYARP